MKKLVCKFSLFILGITLILVSYFSQPSAGINNAVNNISIPDSQFQIGAFSYYVPNNYRFTQLGFNVWHKYTQLETGWTDYDKYDDTNDTRDIINTRLGINQSDGLRTYFDRPIVEYVIAGQRIDYECESINTQEDLFWFNKYGFVGTNEERLIYEVQDTSKYGKYEEIPYGSNDSTARVIYCKRDNNNPESNAGYIDSNLYANRNLSYDLAANDWSDASYYDWYIMPRIRIDSSYAANPNNTNDTICRIEILGWNGNIVKAISLNVSNFKSEPIDIYKGDYLESFYYSTGQDSLFLPKSVIKSSFIPDTASKVLNWKIPCKVDIRIYWTGKCDMWIDRVRVENDPAHKYLTLKDDFNQFLISKINLESDLSITNYNSTNPIPNYFYFEECTINHFPSIRALNKQIMTATSNQNSLLVWLNNFQVNALIPFPDSNRFHADEYSRLIKDYCGMPALVIGWYGLEGWDTLTGRISYHPNSLTDAGYSIVNKILSYPTSTVF